MSHALYGQFVGPDPLPLKSAPIGPGIWALVIADGPAQLTPQPPLLTICESSPTYPFDRSPRTIPSPALFLTMEALGKPTETVEAPLASMPDPPLSSMVLPCALNTEPIEDDGFMFPNEHGGPLDPDSFSARFRRLVRKAGLRPTRLHDLRHAHASHLISIGKSPLFIQHRLGHSKIEVTLGTYGHLFSAMEADDVEDAAGQIYLQAEGGSL